MMMTTAIAAARAGNPAAFSTATNGACSISGLSQGRTSSITVTAPM